MEVEGVGDGAGGSTKRMGNLSSAFEKADRTNNVVYLSSTSYFIPVLAIGFQIATSCRRWWCNFKGLSNGGRTDFSANSLFNDDLANEPTFSQSHLAEQYI